jgi:hypothetical protein
MLIYTATELYSMVQATELYSVAKTKFEPNRSSAEREKRTMEPNCVVKKGDDPFSCQAMEG